MLLRQHHVVNDEILSQSVVVAGMKQGSLFFLTLEAEKPKIKVLVEQVSGHFLGQGRKEPFSITPLGRRDKAAPWSLILKGTNLTPHLPTASDSITLDTRFKHIHLRAHKQSSTASL